MVNQRRMGRSSVCHFSNFWQTKQMLNKDTTSLKNSLWLDAVSVGENLRGWVVHLVGYLFAHNYCFGPDRPKALTVVPRLFQIFPEKR